MPGIFGFVVRSPDDTYDPDKMLKKMSSTMCYENFYRLQECRVEGMQTYAGIVGFDDDDFLNRSHFDSQRKISVLTSEPVCESLLSKFAIPSADAGPSSAAQWVLADYYRSADLLFQENPPLVSGVIIDEHTKKIVIFNDLYGMERIFYSAAENFFVFASEAKAILSILPHTRRFDKHGLSEFLTCGCSLGERSLFNDIRILPYGSFIQIDHQKTLHKKQYVDIQKFEQLSAYDEQHFLDIFKDELLKSVNGYITDPATAAISITGGLDSRLILAAMKNQANRIPCYTFGSMYRETYDVVTAKQVTEQTRNPHSVINLDSHFLEKFQNYLSRAVFISDGYLGFSGASELYLNSRARHIAPYRVTGNYGGELLRGIRAFNSNYPKGPFIRPSLSAYIREAIHDFDELCKMQPLTFTLFCQIAAGYGRHAVERSQVKMRNPFLTNELINAIYRKPYTVAGLKDPTIPVIKHLDPALTAIPTDRGQLGHHFSSLRRVFRELVFKAEYLTGHGMPETVARYSNTMLLIGLQRFFAGRHKFQHFRTWLQHELSDQLVRLIEGHQETSLQDFIDFKQFNQMVKKHIAGKHNFLDEIDAVITILLTEQLLMNDFNQVAKG
jgi:asparagine synthase (glutamine-hydrolysing)